MSDRRLSVYNPPRRVVSPWDLISTDGYRLRLAHNTDESLGILTTTSPPGAPTVALAGAGAGNLSNGVYTYRVTNYAGTSDTVLAQLFVYRNRVIGGDIHATAMDGFMHGLR